MRKSFAAFLLYAVWIGGGLVLALLAAPAAFKVAPTRTVAADVVGAMLSRWHYVALVVPIALLLGEWRRQLASTRVAVLLSLALLAGSAQVFCDLRIRGIREASLVPISELSPENQTRRQFGRLHGFSTSLMLLQIALAIGAALPERGELGERREGRGAGEGNDGSDERA